MFGSTKLRSILYTCTVHKYLIGVLRKTPVTKSTSYSCLQSIIKTLSKKLRKLETTPNIPGILHSDFCGCLATGRLSFQGFLVTLLILGTYEPVSSAFAIVQLWRKYFRNRKTQKSNDKVQVRASQMTAKLIRVRT